MIVGPYDVLVFTAFPFFGIIIMLIRNICTHNM